MQNELGLDQPAVAFIRAIEVRNLFGYLSYRIGSRSHRRSTDILVLYGDNGSGKTSVLRLLFYLLSPADKRGHKTAAAQISFSRFSVYFDNGIEVAAIRPEGQTIGSFRMTIASGSTVLNEFHFETNSDGVIRITDPEEHARLSLFYTALGQLGIALFFLKDDRSMESTLFADRPDDEPRRVYRVESEDEPATAINAVRVALRRATASIRRQVFRASSRGDADTFNIYVDIVKRLAVASRPKGTKRTVRASVLLKKLKAISARSRELSSIGLMPLVDVGELSALLKKAKQEKLAVMEQVVLPYIDAMTARFNALEPVARALEKFLYYVNKFYRDKSVTFDLQKGFIIRSPVVDRLSAPMLSSGERHLLLLFCNVLVAEERPSLFIIDEPELSLNVRWQRLLINALLDCVKDTKVRFVLATHSVELLAQHRKAVHKLEPIPGAAIRAISEDEGDDPHT
jgi:energy-coupling factor transporter ATP-binding protein EcfA2